MLLALGLLVGCLDFDQFATEPATTSTASAGGGGQGGGTGGAGGGANVGGGGAGGSGGEGVGGSGGGWQPPATSPCFPGDPLSDDFEGPQLSWYRSTGTVDYGAGQALLTGTTELQLDRAMYAGTMAGCHFQIEMVKADAGAVYMQLRSVANEFGDNLTYRLRDGEPEIEVAPGGLLTLLDDGSMTSGVVRIGELDGSYFVATAPVASGPWTLRFEGMAPAWFQSDVFLVIGISPMSAGTTAIFDNLNLP